MGKPREFWIWLSDVKLLDNRQHHCLDEEQYKFHYYDGNLDNDRKEPVRVIDKSAYDKAIEALKWSSCGKHTHHQSSMKLCENECKIAQALIELGELNKLELEPPKE
jgi:hypothetical protein